MGFENFPTNENTGSNEAKKYYEQFPEGIRRDTEVAFNKLDRYDYLKTEAPEELKELFGKIEDIIEVESNQIPAFTEQIVRAIRDAANAGGWTAYDYNFALIRKKLEEYGVPLKERKTSKDYDSI